jgi:hypothetical protein
VFDMTKEEMMKSAALREFMEVSDFIIASRARRRARLAAEAAANLQSLEEQRLQQEAGNKNE